MRTQGFERMQFGGDSNRHRAQLAMACPQLMIGVSLFLFVVVAVLTQRETVPANQGARGTIKKNLPPTMRHRDEGLGIAWLMSFPNSGTSFTSKLVRHVTALSTATNYGEESEGGLGIFDSNKPPFWLDPHSISSYSRPTKLVLTKTHCGGRCELCGPKTYIESPHSFLMQCLSGRGINDLNATKHVSNVMGYEKSLVRKAVHLIRSPFDNIVSRFHLEIHTSKKEKARNHQRNLGSMLNYTEDSVGFRSFCAMLDQTYHNEEKHSRWIDDRAMSVMKDVPCRADIVRYVQWHNLAFVVTRDLGIPTMELHYEDYQTEFEEIVEQLVKFLETDVNGEVIDFVIGKSYAKDYFTPKERLAIRDGVEQLAMQETWDNIHHYFEE
mmetsp:Transcript_7891/g.12338  ORF Transcript_7891/g.12338 Transcript_7891/m.12338 type:complete len:382 (+) Transcript_7891:246-1391(+)